MGRPKRDDKLVLMNATVGAALRSAVYQLADELHVSKAGLAGELILLGLMVRTGQSVEELLKASSNGHVTVT